MEKWQYKLLLLLPALLIGLFNRPLQAQFTITTTQPGPSQLEMCVDSSVFQFSLTCTDPSLTNVQLDISFPQGIRYVANSLTNTSGANPAVSENQYVGQVLTLDGGNIVAGQTYDFSIILFAQCDALADFQAGQVFANALTINDGGGVIMNYTSPPFNQALDYGDLSMSLGGTPSGSVGQTVTRTVNIFSTGSACLKSVFWYDQYEADIQVDSVYFQGQKLNIQQSGDSVFYTLGEQDFLLHGNGDAKFCQADGPLVLTEYIQILGCNNKNSLLGVGWGCDSSLC
ncbi:MAG: hypothetical protein AAFP92_29930, partial [Bacteroidota bacterium]